MLSTRRVVPASLVLLSALLLALVAPAPAAASELDPLREEVVAYLAGGAPSARESARLVTRLSAAETIAGAEADAARKLELLGRIGALRDELALFARRTAAGESALGAGQARGTIAGRVTAEGGPLAGARITAFRLPDGGLMAGATTAADGSYSLDLEPATHVVYAEPPAGAHFSPQLYDGLSCRLAATCELFEGTRLEVAAGGSLTADFDLERLGRIEGEVRSAETLEPVETVVKLFDRAGAFVEVAESAGGRYVFGGVPAGEYYVVASGQGILTGAMYRDVPCHQFRFGFTFDCPRELGAKVEVAFEQVVTGIDFDLRRGATLRGKVLSRSGSPVPQAVVEVFFPGAVPHLVAYPNLVDGGYEVTGLATGRVFLRVTAPFSTAQVYPLRNCAGEQCLAVAQGIDLVLGQDRTGLDFALDRPGRMTGRVADAATGLPVSGAHLTVTAKGFDEVLDERFADGSGSFDFGSLPAIELVVKADHALYRPEYYDDVDARLGPGAAKAVAIAAGQIRSGVDFALDKRGSISGRVVDAATGSPLQLCTVRAITGATELAAGVANCRNDGTFLMDGLLPGSYWILADEIGPQPVRHVRYLHGKGSCNTSPDGRLWCFDLDEGTRVAVRSGEVAGPLELRLEEAAVLAPLVTFAAGPPSPEPSARLRVFESDGDEVRIVPLLAGAAPQIRVAPGSYRVGVDGSPAWQSYAGAGLPCGRWYCGWSQGPAFAVGAGEERSLPFHLEPLAPYAGCVADAHTLCLSQGRYEVRARWGDFLGVSGSGIAHAITVDSGYFHFFSPSNVEVLAKVLNGCDPRLGHHFWFYAAGLTNVQVTLEVEDTLTGESQLYTNLLGATFQPILDSAAFATCDAVETVSANAAAGAAAPLAAATAPEEPALGAGLAECGALPVGGLCLGQRFGIQVRYRTDPFFFPLGAAFGRLLTDDTAAFYFYDANNYELMVKVLDACSTATPGFWVFAAGLTDLEVELQVEDLATGRSKVYRNEPGPYAPILDLGTFPCD